MLGVLFATGRSNHLTETIMFSLEDLQNFKTIFGNIIYVIHEDVYIIYIFKYIYINSYIGPKKCDSG